ncbi:hypothetical protein G6F37_010252 [Rhizopus arrhizus]|nr:hypothetical protein G6F38_008383 [Rhizopus arrhizus]KAG1153556.1 hypothetical protein G6F37_010252 [Rhizopus arrhizus]
MEFCGQVLGCGHGTFVPWYRPALKVDLRTLHDRVQQRYNIETDVDVFEVAEEEPGNVKYICDRCKVMIESKAAIDRFVFDGCLIDSVDPLQVCSLEIHFGNTTLAEPGLYVDDLIMKQSSIRGSWNPPRTSKTSPPPPSNNLFGNDS